jgi:hypothetical protein
MTNAEASRERTRLWSQLKPLLRRSLGARGAAEWLAFAALQEAKHADKIEAGNVIELARCEWTP